MAIDLLLEHKKEIFQEANNQALDRLHQLNAKKQLKFPEQSATLPYNYGEEYYDFHLNELRLATELDFTGVFTNPYVYDSPWYLRCFDEIQFVKSTRRLVKKEMDPHKYHKMVAEMTWESITSSIVSMRQLHTLIKNKLSPGEKVEYYQIWVHGNLDEVKFTPIHQTISLTLDQLLEHGVGELDERIKVEIFV